MALPPEQINIKRRREEEPVETLLINKHKADKGEDIQSELHQTKRRFTDFVFQRVQIRGKDGGGGGGAASGDGDDDDASASASSPASGVPQPTRQRVLRTPRSVSSLKVAKGGSRNVAGVSGSAPSAPPPPPPGASGGGGGGGGGGGVPLVRATSPGAEIREEKRLAALRREKEEKIRRAVYSSQSPPRAESSVPSRNENASSAAGAAGESGRSSPASISSSGKPPIRRFQISRSSTNTPVNLHRGFDSGIQKRKGVGAGAGGSDGVAVLVEKLRRKPHSRQASMAVDSALQSAGVPAAAAASAESRPRKRPVVNQAERKWREERKNAISTAKKHINDVMDKGAQAQNKGNWDDESDQLAGEFERIALELDDGSQMDETKTPAESTGPAERTGARLSNPPKPSLKYQPRTPNKPRSTERQPTATTQHDDRGGDTETESDGDYVYDVYIRRPLPQSESQSQTQQPQPQPQAAKLKNPLTDLEKQNALGPNVGVIVITQEDESYWNYFIEDDDDDEAWDSEDADSNAENNPANDYPDEELSWDDSDDDDGSNPFARYRQAGFDEDFDFDDSGSEGSFDPGLRRAAYGEYDSDEEW